MSDCALPVLFTIFIWWFTTGLVLLLDNLPTQTFRWSILVSTALSIGALFGLAHTAQQTSLAGAYCAFTCALLAWGWHELTFLTGWLTGPRRVPATRGARGWLRLREAVAAILWHELALIATGLAIVALTWEAPNQVGNWTFLVLWIMRTSAKLNLYLGVRNLNEAFLPPHLVYLGSFFRRRAMNALWPFAVAAACWVLALLCLRALHPDTLPAARAGLMLVSTLLAMAILEHGLLVLPLESTALWRWALRNRPGPVAASRA